MKSTAGTTQQLSQIRWIPGAILGAFLSCASFVAPAALAQQPPPVNFTAEQDHQNMMDQLGIKALREGPSGDEKRKRRTTRTTTSRWQTHFPTCRMCSR
jgi:hypothetical protein